ncbi:uncharacterized protein PGTG_19106 [Puccinia graminis f. sp. tritici CRL 75-36-700-3]|uniref:Uncharacterized protein n=1 Tax=Puccinia graminis f. sp. tritici (strain CRL 75-36-700-3 / race SCCL) TaxID=418459 RepID=E3L9X8_PUCGT|nr:uncharacterized protein PGTG_19086 [Puccinia graminis f. sp. tritici CRL 75-36-700-3]XP_003337792.1 uncharacterized protein PGTG_19106 [Puccinia graminis f. sp. tritici CRL 75-36-700-3]EFP93353.1 hypothetical protein PGTG_19086 [Puccinia graminis f. sp. tritici CRL 75-36-700-3]EFP93373.1 hypothetical protein PGTG_19106 [Puccinia graminis f. sp. tritici CRL 75-36-700-3]
MPSTANLSTNQHQQQESLAEELISLGHEIIAKLGESNLTQDHIHGVMEHLNYLVGGCYGKAGFSYNSYIRALVQILHQVFHRKIIELTVAITNKLDFQKVV